MMAPEHERRRMLGVAIDRAIYELRAPIDRIEVTNEHVICWAGPKKITMFYTYAPGGQVDSTGRFFATPGSGSWEVTVIDGPAMRRLEIIRETIGRLMKPERRRG